MQDNNKAHWERIYLTKHPSERSWTQEVPGTSLHFIHLFNLSKTARIIDIGGGDSKLVDCLLQEGYQNITVLDISEQALEQARHRLGKKAEKVQWIASDITRFQPHQKYDLWHDRATFHFLTEPGQVEAYLDIAKKAVTGYMTIGTFSTNGPEKCSGLPVKQYNEEHLAMELQNGFSKVECITEDHITPFHTRQQFLFCGFRRSA